MTRPVFILLALSLCLPLAAHELEPEDMGGSCLPEPYGKWLASWPRSQDDPEEDLYLTGCLFKTKEGRTMQNDRRNPFMHTTFTKKGGEIHAAFSLAFTYPGAGDAERERLSAKVRQFIEGRMRPFLLRYRIVLDGTFADSDAHRCPSQLNCVEVRANGVRGSTYNAISWGLDAINGREYGEQVMSNLCLHEFVHLLGTLSEGYTRRIRRADDIMNDCYDAHRSYRLYPWAFKEMLQELCPAR